MLKIELYKIYNHLNMSIGRASFDSVSFYILGDDDVAEQACGITNSKALFSEGVPVPNGLYDPHLGATDLAYNCQTCAQNKIYCPGHDGMARMNYPLQSPLFRKDILKWLRVVCHQCGEFVIKKDPPAAIPAENRLSEYVKLVRTGTEKYRKCAWCDAVHPWVTKDALKAGVIWCEWYSKGNKTRSDRKEILYNQDIQTILGRIPDANVIKMGKTPESHPKKLVVKNIKVSSTVIRPEIRKIGGNRSTMSDITAHLRTIMELNGQIPKEIPGDVDADLHAKLVLVDLTFFEMIQGSSGTTSSLRLVTNTNKVSNSIAARLPKKHGRLRANLMGKRTTKMMRSVITGDKALRPDQVAVPRSIAKSLFIPETVRSWNRARLTKYFKNGPKAYPGCSKIKRVDTGHEHYVESMTSDYILKDGDVVYRHIIDGDKLKLFPTVRCA